MNREHLNLLLKAGAVCGNAIFIFWGMYNGMNEGFNGTVVERYSFLGLISLLSMNCFLLLADRAAVINQRQKSN